MLQHVQNQRTHSRLRLRLRFRGRWVRPTLKTRRIRPIRIATVKRKIQPVSRASLLGMVGNIRLKGRHMSRSRGRTHSVAPRRRRTISFETNANVWRSMGSRLQRPLVPNRELFDLFDKHVRADVVRGYFGGTHHHLSNPTSSLEFPSRLMPMFAISIRPTRFENLQDRLGPWSAHLQHWQGTVGSLLDGDRLKADGIAARRLKRGEIGCYDSHMRLWRHMVNNQLPHAFILEDDCDVHYGQPFLDRVHQMFGEIQKHQIQFDVIYLGHNNNKRPKKQQGCLGVPANTQGLFCYFLTQEGARKLLDTALPMKQAVDDYVFLCRNMRQLTLEPRLCWVVAIEQSDTASVA